MRVFLMKINCGDWRWKNSIQLQPITIYHRRRRFHCYATALHVAKDNHLPRRRLECPGRCLKYPPPIRLICHLHTNMGRVCVGVLLLGLTLCTNRINVEAAADEQDCCWQVEKINGFRRQWGRHCFLLVGGGASSVRLLEIYCLRCLLLPLGGGGVGAAPPSRYLAPVDKCDSNGMIYRTVCSVWKISKEITKLISNL